MNIAALEGGDGEADEMGRQRRDRRRLSAGSARGELVLRTLLATGCDQARLLASSLLQANQRAVLDESLEMLVAQCRDALLGRRQRLLGGDEVVACAGVGQVPEHAESGVVGEGPFGGEGTTMTIDFFALAALDVMGGTELARSLRFARSFEVNNRGQAVHHTGLRPRGRRLEPATVFRDGGGFPAPQTRRWSSATADFKI